MRLLLVVAAMLSCMSCTTTRVQNAVLTPAIEEAYVDVRADAELGGAPLELLETWDVGIASRSLRGLDVAALTDFALLGVDQRLISGEIGPMGAANMRRRATNFRAAVEEATRIVVVRYEERGPTVISRSSWATHPPAAIADRVYR